MEIEERYATFIASLDSGHPPYLENIYERAKGNHVPVIGREIQGILKLFLTMQKPKRILEVGTAVGFSTLLMREYGPGDCEIVTIEKDEARYSLAAENFAEYDKGKRIRLLLGDAADILETLDGVFDLIFMDAAKGQYLIFLPEVLKLLHTGGVLLTDNVLQDGDMIESRYVIKRRDRTIHGRMRDYLYELKHRAELCTEILTVGDGVAVSYKM